MSSPINLNRERKRRAAVESAAKASENRAKFGRTKAEKRSDEIAAAKAKTALDRHKRDQ